MASLPLVLPVIHENRAGSMIKQFRHRLPVSTPVIVSVGSKTGTGTLVVSESVGTIVAWGLEARGSWHAKSGIQGNRYGNGKLVLHLLLRKVDGEMTACRMTSGCLKDSARDSKTT